MRSLALCVLVFVAAPAAAEDKPEWIRFTPKNAKCSVEMPSKPATQPVQEINQNGVKLKFHMFILELDGGKTGYALGFSELPANPDTDEVTKKVLKGAQDGTTKAIKGEIVSERQITLGKYLGREFTLDLPSGTQYRARLFVIEGHLYQVIAVGSKEFINGFEARTFLYSFELTE
jgi:hypothetical protein